MKTLSIRAYANHLNRDKTLIRRWIKAGKLDGAYKQTGRKYEIDVKKADALLSKSIDKSKSRRVGTSPLDGVVGDVPLSEQRSFSDAQMKEKYLAAALKQHELKVRKGEYVKKIDVEKEAFECGRQARDAILNVPSLISATLAAKTDSHEIEKLLTDELRQALEGLVE